MPVAQRSLPAQENSTGSACRRLSGHPADAVEFKVHCNFHFFSGSSLAVSSFALSPLLATF
jgi:hypothetical protein